MPRAVAGLILCTVPSTRDFKPVAQEPLLGIFPIGSELFFEFLDSAHPIGKPVLKFLQDGFNTDPPETRQTTADRATATWYRFA